MLDFIENNAADEAANQCMEQFYSKTLESFQATNNERLWLSTNTKLARLWLAQKDYERLTEKVRELHKACQREDGTDDPSKGTYSMEAYALEIQMYAETRNNKRLKVLQMLFLDCGYEANTPTGLVPARTEGALSCATSQDYGYHPRVWRKDAHERRYARDSYLPASVHPANLLEQKTGTKHRVTSSSPSATTTRPALSSVSRC